jgi:hypothetical protein
MWLYEIRGDKNRLVEKSKAVYITEKEALANGGHRASQMTNSVGYPGGVEVFSVVAGRKPDFIQPDPVTQKQKV